MKYLFVRLSCQKERGMWDEIRRQNTNQIIICGDQSIDDHYKLVDDVLYLKCRDSYDGLPEKMIFAFNALLDIKKFSDVERFIKLDSDLVTCNDFQMSERMMANDFSGPHLVQDGDESVSRIYHFQYIKDSKNYWYNRPYDGPYSRLWLMGGFGYALSRKGMELLCDHYGFEDREEIYKTHIYEDIMIASILHNKGVIPVEC